MIDPAACLEQTLNMSGPPLRSIVVLKLPDPLDFPQEAAARTQQLRQGLRRRFKYCR